MQRTNDHINNAVMIDLCMETLPHRGWTLREVISIASRLRRLAEAWNVEAFECLRGDREALERYCALRGFDLARFEARQIRLDDGAVVRLSVDVVTPDCEIIYLVLDAAGVIG